MEKIMSYLADWISFRLTKYYFCFFLLMGSLSSCFQKYYATNTRDATNAATLKVLQSEGKIFIVHSMDGAFVMSNPSVVGNSFSGYADSLTPRLRKHLDPEADSANRIRGGQDDLVCKQVHLYVDSISQDHGRVNLDITKIHRVDVYGLDKAATKSSTISSIVGISIVAGLITSMAIYATSIVGF